MRSIVSRNNRHSIRLSGYDYSSPGMYFITICTHENIRYFGLVKNGQMHLNDAGKMVENVWKSMPDRFPEIRLHEFIVMPNHFHGIIEIARTRNSSLSKIMGAFKSIVAVNYIRGIENSGWKQFDVKLWHRNYYERIIRDRKIFDLVTSYIRNNPAKWKSKS